MAPSPEDDNAPKAPDKLDKNKSEKAGSLDNPKERDKDEKTLSNLNDGELKALLDEAMNYKNPKDREGKSKLFKDLLNQAEESERIARAASAGGSELVRHCNPAAKRRKGGRHQRAAEAAAARERRSSAAEHPMHGGSLDNLAKEELYARCSASRSGALGTGASRRTVSSRQREGGSLPCDVNSSLMPTRDYQFLEEARKSKAMKNKDFTTIDIDALESQSLLEHDVLAQNYQEAQEPPIVPTYTSKATLQISATPVDDPIPLDLDSAVDKKTYDSESLQTKVYPSKYSIYIHEKKLDENGNAVQQNPGTKIKKKKNQTDKNVVILKAELVKGHRSDIIDDVDKLMQYIGGDKDKEWVSSGKSKSNLHKSKQLHKQHASEDGGTRSKKQRAHSSKGKESRSELKKSNSLGQISAAQLDDFSFASGNCKDENKVVLRASKGQVDRPKERRSWGNVEIIHSNEKDSIQFNAQMLPPNIPDVQTIEKMQFMNRPPPPLPVTATVAYHHHQRPPPLSPPPPTAAASYPSNCDSSERTISAETTAVGLEAADQEEDELADEGRIPPVIILSGGGTGGKEVPGLVFGFDINEQLLSEDICDSFVARYVAPESFTHHSHNHDKIVNFIGSAWDAIINQTNGKVQFYTEES